jgi:tetratricopeptide (TPR) repeat protein
MNKTPSRLRFILYLGLVFVSLHALAQSALSYDGLVQRGNTQLQAGSNDAALATASTAIKANAGRWEAYAVAGGALLNLKRYEEAEDQFSHAIDHAPEAKQEGLRTLRKQCLSTELGSPSSASQSVSSGLSVPSSPGPSQGAFTSQAEIVLWKTIEHSTNSADFSSYLSEYPHGAFAVLAQRRVDEMKIIWTDPATGLMWTKEDSDEEVNWQQAADHCKNLTLGGYADWRLPELYEFKGIFDLSIGGAPTPTNPYPIHLKGYLLVRSFEWTNARYDFFLPYNDNDINAGDSPYPRALCVRHL